MRQHKAKNTQHYAMFIYSEPQEGPARALAHVK